jgi:hypothetical protein
MHPLKTPKRTYTESNPEDPMSDDIVDLAERDGSLFTTEHDQLQVKGGCIHCPQVVRV